MNKAAVLALLLLFFAILVIVDLSSATMISDSRESDLDGSASHPPASPLASTTSIPLPTPSTLLLIGSGLIGLIIFRKKYKDLR